MVTQEQLAAMSPNQVRGLIFGAGFSTAETISNVSGRGVGMDVVRTNIEKIGGTIQLDSVEGQGTTFTIKIPLTLAIVSAFVVEASEQRFAVPQINVMEIVSLNAAESSGHRLAEINGVQMLRLRDKIYPLVKLSQVMGLADSKPETVLVCQVGSDMFGILVDDVLDTEEIVVKPLSAALQNVDLYSGNTILGDGSVIMILDPNGLLSSFGAGAKGEDLSTDIVDETSWQTADKIQILLFEAGGHCRKAVHLALVARLEKIETKKIKISNTGEYLVQYLDQLMPIVTTGDWDLDMEREYQSVIVFVDNGRSMGLAVDNISEIVEDIVSIDISSDSPELIGSAIINGDTTDVMDVSYYLSQALGDWFQKSNTGMLTSERDYNVLLVDDSQFFRNMLSPLIEAQGYRVHTAKDPEEGMRMLETMDIDVLISDIEMPIMNGLEFIGEVRKNPNLENLPAVAVSSHTSDEDYNRGIQAGFTHYLAKMDRENLFEFLKKSTSGIRQ